MARARCASTGPASPRPASSVCSLPGVGLRAEVVGLRAEGVGLRAEGVGLRV